MFISVLPSQWWPWTWIWCLLFWAFLYILLLLLPNPLFFTKVTIKQRWKQFCVIVLRHWSAFIVLQTHLYFLSGGFSRWEPTSGLSLWIKATEELLREVKHSFLHFHQIVFKETKFTPFQQVLKSLGLLMEAHQEEKQAGNRIFYRCLKTRKEARGHMQMKICEQTHYKFICEPGCLSSRGFWWPRCCLILFLPLNLLGAFLLFPCNAQTLMKLFEIILGLKTKMQTQL